MLRSLTRLCVRYAERYIPDPFLYAILLTFLTVAGALIWTKSDLFKIVDAWYTGIWAILAFALQMALILATGIALADTKPVKRLLAAIASIPKNQTGACVTVFLGAAAATWLNWGFGLVIGALLAREVGKRVKELDFGFLVASAYMGDLVWASGLSSSIALASATKGSNLNIIEQLTGKVTSFDQTIFAAYNVAPMLLIVVFMPVILIFMAPRPHEMKKVDPALLQDDAAPPAPETKTFATMIENAWPITALLVLMGAAYEYEAISAKGFTLDINGLIFISLMLGLAFHGTPIRYVRSFNAAAKTVGPILLQFPLYGGIMGIMTTTGLAALIAQGFVSFSTAHTLPFWSFISSNIITLFIPSGGGHWAVQGPFMVPAALQLGADPAMTAMGTAMGEQTANMLQPFWALPILAIARLGIKDIMGYCVIALIVSLVIYGGSLLIFA